MRVTLTADDETPWQVSADGTGYRTRVPGGDAEAQVFELRYPPGCVSALHAHEVDEIIYVAAGTMMMNGCTVGPGALLTVPAHAFYGYDAGPDGLHVLIYRPKADSSLLKP